MRGGMTSLSSVCAGLENITFLLSRKSRLGMHHMLAFLKHSITTSDTPVIFRTGLMDVC